MVRHGATEWNRTKRAQGLADVELNENGLRQAKEAAVRLASALAPTHPHPGNETASRALLVGTPMAMMDRARDLLRGAMAGRSKADGDAS